MTDGVHMVYCSRPGCGKEVGAQRWEHGKVVEEEWIPGVVHEDGDIYFCSQECSEHRDEFLTPEEVEDADE